MKITWYSPAGTEIVFSKDSENYRLLKKISGFTTNPVKHLTTNGPYQDGDTREDTVFKSRPVSFDVLVQAPDLENLQIALRILAIALNPLPGPGTLIYESQDGTQYYLTAIGDSDNPVLSDSERTPTSQLVTLNFIAHDPFLYSYPPEITYFGVGTPVKFPFTMPFTFPVGTRTQTIRNIGNVSAGVKIVISGAVVDPAITREYTLLAGTKVTETLAFSHTFPAGDVLTITTAYGKKVITIMHADGTYEANPYQYLVSGYSFWQLVPGENKVSVDYTSVASSTQISVEHSSKFGGIS